jgi:hypothetical protein
MPVIAATPEAEIKNIVVQGQARQKATKIPSQQINWALRYVL